MILDKSKLNNINNQMERNSERKREENKEEILETKIVNEKEAGKHRRRGMTLMDDFLQNKIKKCLENYKKSL